MVVQRYIRHAVPSFFWAFSGAAIMILSIGLSWSIAKSNSLFYDHDTRNLQLSKVACSLTTQAEILESLAEKTEKNALTQKTRVEAIEVKKTASETKEVLESLAVD